MTLRVFLFVLTVLALVPAAAHENPVRGTGDLGIVIERASGSLLVVDTTEHRVLHRVTGLGDLSHASAVFSRDARYAFVFGRDGALTKVDLLTGRIVKRIQQAGNSIGGAISQNGRYVAASNYEPGGVRIFSSDDLTLLRDVPAVPANGDEASKVVGLVDAPGNRFVFTLFEAGEIWILNMDEPDGLRKFTGAGKQPYDALMTPDGRHYIAGLFGEDGLALLDLWHLDDGVRRILPDYGRGERPLPVYKMPHLEGWAVAGERAFVPAVGLHRVLAIDTRSWQQIQAVDVQGQPVFVMAEPGGRRIWVSFAFPDNDHVQIIDSESLEVLHRLKVGKSVLHMEFTARGEQVWISARDDDRVCVYDTATLARQTCLPAQKPSGIFFSHRAHLLGR